MTTPTSPAYDEILAELARWAPQERVPPLGQYPESYRRTYGEDCTGCASFRVQRGRVMQAQGTCEKHQVFTSQRFVCADRQEA